MADRYRLLPTPPQPAFGSRIPLLQLQRLGLGPILVGDVKIKDAVVGVPVVVTADTGPQEPRVRHDDNVLLRPVVQLAQGSLAAGDDGFLGGEVLGTSGGRLVREDGVDLGEIDFGEPRLDLFDGVAGIARFCRGFWRCVSFENMCSCP